MTRTTARALAQREQTLKALNLRKAGATYAQIAETCGYSAPQAACRAVQRALAREQAEAVADLRQLQAARLDDLLRVLYPRALKGDYGAIDRIHRLEERRAKLYGLDAPVQVQNEQLGATRIVIEYASNSDGDSEDSAPDSV